MFKRFNWNNFLKGIILVSLVYIIYEVSHTWPLYYPDSFFDYRTTHRNFNLYSDRSIDDNLLELIDETAVRMKSIETYDPVDTHHVYLVHDYRLFGSFAEKLNMSNTIQALTIHPFGYVLLNLSAIERTANMYKNRYSHTLYRGDPAYTLSHELMHVLTTGQLGFFSSWFLPDWKREGYAEYGASLYDRRQDSTYSLAERVNLYNEGYYDNLSENQQFYIRSGLIVEYLLDIEQLEFDHLMNKDIPADTIYHQLQQWLGSQTPDARH